jgi:hypothetical protein
MNHESNVDINPNVDSPVLNFKNFQISALSLRIFLPIPHPSLFSQAALGLHSSDNQLISVSAMTTYK